MQPASGTRKAGLSKREVRRLYSADALHIKRASTILSEPLLKPRVWILRSGSQLSTKGASYRREISISHCEAVPISVRPPVWPPRAAAQLRRGGSAAAQPLRAVHPLPLVRFPAGSLRPERAPRGCCCCACSSPVTRQHGHPPTARPPTPIPAATGDAV